MFKSEDKTGKNNNNAEFHMDEGRDAWLIIPKSDYTDAVAGDAGDWWQRGDEQRLQAWARKVYSESGEPIDERIYDLPSGLNCAILAGDYKVPVALQQRTDRHAVETGA